MSTQEKGPVVGDHSSIYMNTEEVATRMADDNHNIGEALSQRIGISQGGATDRTRALELQRSMQSSMKSNKKNPKTIKGNVEATSFGDHQSSVEFQRQGDLVLDQELESQPIASAMPYTFVLQEERYLENLDTRCIIQFDEEKFIACVWGQSEIYVIDREKPDAVNSFESGGSTSPSKQNLSI